MTQSVQSLQANQRIYRLPIRGLGSPGREHLLVGALGHEDDELQAIGMINCALQVGLDRQTTPFAGKKLHAKPRKTA